MIKSGIFDVGGVLHAYDDNDSLIENDIKKTLEISPDVFEKAWSSMTPLLQRGEISEAEYWKKFLSETKTTKPLPKESLLVREFSKAFSPRKDVLAIVRELKNNGYKLAVLSNTILPHVEFLEKRGIFNDFDVRVFSDSVGITKPDPQIYLLTLNKLGVSAEEAFYVDDKEKYVKPANSLGMHGILFSNAEKLKKDLKEIAVELN